VDYIPAASQFTLGLYASRVVLKQHNKPRTDWTQAASQLTRREPPPAVWTSLLLTAMNTA